MRRGKLTEGCPETEGQHAHLQPGVAKHAVIHLFGRHCCDWFSLRAVDGVCNSEVPRLKKGFEGIGFDLI